jgi:hypothetical protein
MLSRNNQGACRMDICGVKPRGPEAGVKTVLRTAASLSLLIVGISGPVHADDGSPLEIAKLSGTSYPATDSLETGDDPSPDARACLQGLVWNAASFEVQCTRSPRSDRGDLLIRFPSPVESGLDQNDQVAMEWYIARDENDRPTEARAVVVVHESGSRMTVGRLIARGLRHQGLHAFLLHLPYYGERRPADRSQRDANFVNIMRQAIADARRARDAVAALPLVDASHIALQGTSLGGFVSATTGSLDRGYDSVFVMLAGGELYEVIQKGKRDTVKVREKLAEAGLEGEQLRSQLWTIEPTRVAHRLDPQRTWLFSGIFDTVVPPQHAHALANAARLDDTHHVQLLADHYTGIIYLPFVLDYISKQIASIESKLVGTTP